jgi:cytochrome c peroxidase
MTRKHLSIAAFVCAAVAIAYTAASRSASGIPFGYPAIRVPPENPMSDGKAALGRWLFYDRRLSVTASIACADCHRQQFAFADPRARSVGATGERTSRNAMTLANVAYNGRYTWADNTLKTLEQQARIPLTGNHPLEMGVLEDERGIMNRIREDQRYVELFAAAFPESDDAVNLENVIRAISSFERTLISLNAPFDRFLAGDDGALSDSAQRGFRLFRSERLKCARCHDGFNFRMTPGHRTTEDDDSVAYHNTGLYNVDGRGGYPEDDRGLFEVTRNRDDMGRFKAPTLRNIAVTAPYMHDGSVATLEDVIEHYAAGGRVTPAGANAGDGRASPYKSGFVTGFAVTAQEKRDVTAFLESLTDAAFLTNPAFSNPFPPAP